jgi:hypothetical protein
MGGGGEDSSRKNINPLTVNAILERKIWILVFFDYTNGLG